MKKHVSHTFLCKSQSGGQLPNIATVKKRHISTYIARLSSCVLDNPTGSTWGRGTPTPTPAPLSRIFLFFIFLMQIFELYCAIATRIFKWCGFGAMLRSTTFFRPPLSAFSGPTPAFSRGAFRSALRLECYPSRIRRLSISGHPSITVRLREHLL